MNGATARVREASVAIAGLAAKTGDVIGATNGSGGGGNADFLHRQSVIRI